MTVLGIFSLLVMYICTCPREIYQFSLQVEGIIILQKKSTVSEIAIAIAKFLAVAVAISVVVTVSVAMAVCNRSCL